MKALVLVQRMLWLHRWHLHQSSTWTTTSYLDYIIYKKCYAIQLLAVAVTNILFTCVHTGVLKKVGLFHGLPCCYYDSDKHFILVRSQTGTPGSRCDPWILLQTQLFKRLDQVSPPRNPSKSLKTSSIVASPRGHFSICHAREFSNEKLLPIQSFAPSERNISV